MPLTVLAADLAGKQPAVLDEGPVAQALVTAMTVPGLYPPVRRGDQRLVDAVVLTPVPTSALTGVDVTIAVNLFGSVTSPAWPGATAGHDAGQSDRDPVVESLELASHAAAAAQTAEADVQVTPDLGRGNWRDFGLAEQYLEAGEEAMEAALPALRALARPVVTDARRSPVRAGLRQVGAGLAPVGDRLLREVAGQRRVVERRVVVSARLTATDDGDGGCDEEREGAELVLGHGGTSWMVGRRPTRDGCRRYLVRLVAGTCGEDDTRERQEVPGECC